MEINDFRSVVSAFNAKRVLVIGDVMLDHYSYGKVTRISPEAPVPIVQIIEERFVPGGAGNVFLNLCELGSATTLLCVVGNDVPAEQIKRSFKASSNCGEQILITDHKRRTTVKHRLIAHRQQLLRVDTEDTASISEDIEVQILAYVETHGASFGCFCIADYGKGCMTSELASKIVEYAVAHNIPLLVDTKPANFSYYKNCTLLTPNESEVLAAYPHRTCVEAAQLLSVKTNTPVLVTRGPLGVSYVTKEGEQFSLPSYANEEEVRDVSGAGDTVVAALALCLCCGLDVKDAAHVASKAAAIAVTKPHTSPVSLAELLEVV